MSEDTIEKPEEKKLEDMTEFECKYRTDEITRVPFKKIAANIEGLKLNGFIYAEGPDRYYIPSTKIDASFARYRKAAHEKKPTECLTFKQRLSTKGSYKRKEPNWIVTGTPLSEIEAGLDMNRYKFNFEIYKYCDIYRFSDATIVFYTVIDEGDAHTSFIEIEVDEATISKRTEEEAWAVIRKYEAILEPLGITYKNRMQKSLFDLFKKEVP